MDTWLSFLCMDEPEEIIALMMEYPEFKPLYQHIYDMCQNVERMMGMFSEELRIMDQNTVKYMVDLMQKELDEYKKKLQEQKMKLQERDARLQEQNMKLQERDSKLQEQNNKIQKLEKELQERNSER